MASSKVSMKLYIDRKNSRVLFAEAGKEFIDFLFNFLAPPVGTLLPHLNREVLSGLHTIDESIQNSSGTYLQPNVLKATLLKPKVYVSGGCADPLLQLPNVEFSTAWIIFGCYEKHTYVSKDYGLNCPMCKRPMNCSYKLIGPSSKPSSGEGGYVKGTITYMVSDDLAVEPLTSIIGTLRNKFNVKDMGALDEKVVDLDMDAVYLITLFFFNYHTYSFTYFNFCSFIC